jgi:multiple sugar transport system permease protein
MAVSTARKKRTGGLINRRTKRVIGRLLLYVIVILMAIWSLMPFLYMMNISLMDTVEVISAPPKWFPWPPKFAEWELVLTGEKKYFAGGTYAVEKYADEEGVGTRSTGGFEAGVTAHRIPFAMIRSIIVALGTTILNLIIGSFAGYGMARYPNFGFVNQTLNLLMITRMLPGLALLIPFFILYRVTGLLNTLHGLIIAYTSFILPLTVWVMRGYFSTVPRSLEWSAQVDGCNWFQAFWRIFLPVAGPGLVAAGIFTFLVAWNEFLFALILVPKDNVQTVTLAIVGLATTLRHRIDDYPALYVGGMIAVIPPVFIAFVFQRYLIQGMLSGAMKG